MKIALPTERASTIWAHMLGVYLLISILFDIIGMTGTALVVGAFFLLQLGKVNPSGIAYNLMNLTGAILLLISLCYNFNLASFVIELFWIVASLIGIYKYYKEPKEQVGGLTDHS